nr:DUF6884 domain-containing protein [Haloprofundus salilacus]
MDVEGEKAAIEVYDGYFYRIIDNADALDSVSWDVVILSAEHGLLDPHETIRPYDREMTPSRATELNDAVVPELARLIAEGAYERLWINLGQTYRLAVDGIESEIDIPVEYLSGRLGNRGNQLKRLLTGSIDPATSIAND